MESNEPARANDRDAIAHALTSTYMFDARDVDRALREFASEVSIEACVDALLDAGAPDRGGPATRVIRCPHDANVRTNDEEGIRFKMTCEECEATKELWTCLRCGIVGCGRYANAHAKAHAKEAHANASQAIGHDDLSVWCYACEAYVISTGTVFENIVRRAEEAKFGS